MPSPAFTLLTSAISGVLLTFVTSHYLIIMLYCSFILFCGLNVTVINGAACDLFPTHLRWACWERCCLSELALYRWDTNWKSNLIASWKLIKIFLEDDFRLIFNQGSTLLSNSSASDPPFFYLTPTSLAFQSDDCLRSDALRSPRQHRLV